MSEGFALTAEAYVELTRLIDRNTRAAEHLEDQTARLLRIIDGNGDPGLRATVASLVSWKQAQEDAQRDLRRAVRNWGLTMFGMLLVALFSFVWNTWNVKNDMTTLQRAIQQLPQQQRQGVQP